MLAGADERPGCCGGALATGAGCNGSRESSYVAMPSIAEGTPREQVRLLTRWGCKLQEFRGRGWLSLATVPCHPSPTTAYRQQ